MNHGWSGLIAGFSLFLAQPAIASERAAPIAVIAVDIAGDGIPALRHQLAQSVERGLAHGGERRVIGLEAAQQRLSKRPELVGCVSTHCLESLVFVLGADQFVRIRVKADGAQFDLAIELWRSSSKDPIATVQDECAVCTLDELNERAQGLAAQLPTGREHNNYDVAIETEPPGLALFIDTRPVGFSPYHGQLNAGRYQVIVRAEDSRVVAQEIIEVKPDRKGNRTVISANVSTTPADPTRRRRMLVSGIGGIALLATGSYLIAIDGDPRCPSGDQRCPDQYQTVWPGVAVASLGAGLAAYSAYLWLEKDDAPSLSFYPVASGAIANLRTSF